MKGKKQKIIMGLHLIFPVLIIIIFLFNLFTFLIILDTDGLRREKVKRDTCGAGGRKLHLVLISAGVSQKGFSHFSY